jgi:hypothetical protein
LYLLETDLDRVLRDNVLCALAWIGDEIVQETFKRWRQTPPPWRSALSWSPDRYAHVAGWELTVDGTRRDLYHAQCYELMAADTATRDALPGPVTVFTHTGERCRWCERHLTILFDCDLHNPRLTFLDGQRKRLCIPMCLNCSLQDERIFSDLDSQGVPRWSAVSGERPEYLDLDIFDGCEELSAQRTLVLGAPRRTPYETIGLYWHTGLSQLGGHPEWVQYPGYPVCPSCRQTMTCVGQLGLIDMQPGTEGMIYAFYCASCGKATTGYQQT